MDFSTIFATSYKSIVISKQKDFRKGLTEKKKTIDTNNTWKKSQNVMLNGGS